MITITPPSKFKTIPWKNGLGKTTELAISENGTLDSFDWRLSIASVVNDGLFSDFSGYQRQLILIEGAGIKLQHDEKTIDILDHPLKMANFDGANKTVGELISGSIKDFNVMTNQKTYQANVKTFLSLQTIQLTTSRCCFIYSPTADCTLIEKSQTIHLPKNHLLKIETDNHSVNESYQLKGENLILIELIKIN